MRSKVNALPISREAVDRELYQIGRLLLRMEWIETVMQQQIDEIKAGRAGELDGLCQRIERLAERLRLRCEDSRQELLPGNRKCLKLLMGAIGWRKQPDTVQPKRGVRQEAVIEALKALSRDNLVRVREEINKVAVAEALRRGGLSQEDMDHCGLRVRLGQDQFYYETYRDSVLDRMRGS